MNPNPSNKFEWISALLNASGEEMKCILPLQNSLNITTLASKGDKYKPQIVSAIIGQDGKEPKINAILERFKIVTR